MSGEYLSFQEFEPRTDAQNQKTGKMVNAAVLARINQFQAKHNL